MPREHPFLTAAATAGEQTTAAAPGALFDLAVNRAAAAVRGAGTVAVLEGWHARTRFARRIPLAQIRQALAQRPEQPPSPDTATNEWHWSGGLEGGWQPGKAPFP